MMDNPTLRHDTMAARPPEGEITILQRIADYHYKDEGDFTVEEFAAFREMASELARIDDDEITFFILGCYEKEEDGCTDRDCGKRVDEVKSFVNSYDNATAYIMTDFPDLNAIPKFRIIAGEVDHIYCIVEHDSGGVMIEQGMIVALTELTEMTHLFARIYPTTEEEHDAYSWMQSEGVFDVFEYHDRFYPWAPEGQMSDLMKFVELVTDDLVS